VTKLKISRVPGEIRKTAFERLRAARLDLVLPAQAKRRIANSGDSEHHYPDLWDNPKSYRSKGETPLSDTGGAGLEGSLTGKMEQTGPSEVTIRLVVPERFRYALYHQSGFSTKGPNFIPLTVKAKEAATLFKPLVTVLSAARKKVRAASGTASFIAALREERRAQEAMESAGFIEGETYIMAWQGVTVPQRKIFNLPPENVEEIREAVTRALK